MTTLALRFLCLDTPTLPDCIVRQSKVLDDCPNGESCYRAPGPVKRKRKKAIANTTVPRHHAAALLSQLLEREREGPQST